MGPSDTLSRCSEDAPSLTQLRVETPESRAPIEIDQGIVDKVSNKGPGSGDRGGEFKVAQQRVSFLKGHSTGLGGLRPADKQEPAMAAQVSCTVPEGEEVPQNQTLNSDKGGPVVGAEIREGDTSGQQSIQEKSENGLENKVGKRVSQEGAGYVELQHNMRGLSETEADTWCQQWGVETERHNMLKELQKISRANKLGGKAHVTTVLNPETPATMPDTKEEQEAVAKKVLKEHVVVWVPIHRTTLRSLMGEAGFKSGSTDDEEYILQTEREVILQASEYQSTETAEELAEFREFKRQEEEAMGKEDDYTKENPKGSFMEEGEEYEDRRRDWERHIEVEDEIRELGEPYYCMEATEFTEEEPNAIKQGSTLEEIKAHLEYGVRACKYKRGLEPKVTPQMQKYIEALCDPNVIRIAVNGAAGTGKTYTAMAYAAMAIKAGIVQRLRCTRPTVSCGSGSGFLPGTSAQKQAPWSAPCTEAAERMGLDDSERAKIGTWPVDKIKGLSLGEGEMLVYDEAQNAEGDSFYCALSRGEQGAKVVIVGDRDQSDLLGKAGINNSVARFVDTWQELGNKPSINLDRITDKEKELYEEARESRASLDTEVRQILLEPEAAMRSKNAKDLNKLWQLDRSGIMTKKGVINTKSVTVAVMEEEMRRQTSAEGSTEYETDKTEMRAPVFAAFAGADNLTWGAQQTCKFLQCIGASEHNGHARTAFERRHGFKPFKSHERVPDGVYRKVWGVFSGAPCVAYSFMGAQKGLSDPRGVYYVEQVDQYTEARVPVIVLEQVTGVRSVPRYDKVSKSNQRAPQSILCEKLRKAGYHIISKGQGEKEEKDGFVLNSADYGSPIDRDRLITIAVRQELWDVRSSEVRFPKERPIKSRNVESVFREIREEYVAKEHHKEDFRESQRMSEKGALRLYHDRVNGKGEPWAPTACYSAKYKAPSPTARGNTRWFEWEDRDGNVHWRRWSPEELCDAQGIEQSVVQGMSPEEKYNVAGNAVPIEMAQAIGEIVQGLWDPEWFIEDKKSRYKNITTPSRREWRPWRDNGGELNKPRWVMRSDHVREDGANTIESESDPTEKPQNIQTETVYKLQIQGPQ